MLLLAWEPSIAQLLLVVSSYSCCFTPLSRKFLFRAIFPFKLKYTHSNLVPQNQD